MATDCTKCGSPDGCEDCGLCWHCGPPCPEPATTAALDTPTPDHRCTCAYKGWRHDWHCHKHDGEQR